MRYRQQYFLIIIILICVGNVFCGKDFLNPSVPGSIQRQLYVNDLQTTQEFLGGVYNSLTPILAGSTMLYADIISDNVKPVVGGSMFSRHYKWMQEASEERANDQSLNLVSTNIYNVISGCNFVIDCTMKFKGENETKSNTIKGQALSIRALMYFLLVNYFSQPYIYTADASHQGVAINMSFDWKALPSRRSTVAEVYDFMLTDLEEAARLLPVSLGSTLYINQYAAKSLLARILLFKGDYQHASVYAREVCNAIPIMTANYPSKLFTLQETEAVFQIDQNLITPVQLASYFFRTSVQFYATADISGVLYESASDTRRNWVSKAANGWSVTKYPQGVIPGVANATISYYHTVIRSSEMYLTASEAYAKMGGGFEDSARFFLNKIRMRADPMAKDILPSGAPLLDSIYKERRKELAFEGFRMFDLLRWKSGVNRVDALDPIYTKLPFGSNNAIAPIPVQDVKLTGYSQNQGY